MVAVWYVDYDWKLLATAQPLNVEFGAKMRVEVWFRPLDSDEEWLSVWLEDLASFGVGDAESKSP